MEFNYNLDHMQNYSSKLRLSSSSTNVLHNELINEINKWQISLMGIKSEDSKYLVEHTSMAFSESNEFEKLVTHIKFIIWFYLFDHFIDNNITDNELWIKVLKEEQNISNTLEEKMFISFWTEMKKNLTEDQRKRFIDSWISFVESNSKEKENKELFNNYSIPEYLNYRELNFNTESLIIGIQYVLGINIFDENNSQIKVLKQLFAEYMIISNDIYSFKREYKDGNVVNIIYNISRIYDISYQKSSIIALQLLSNTEDKLIECFSEIAKQNMDSSNLFLITIEKYLAMNLEFYKVANH
jgi:hypothetical protein